MTDPKVINYAGNQKIYNKEKVDELLDLKQDVITPDTTVQDTDNLVENKAVKAYVDAETQRAGMEEQKIRSEMKQTEREQIGRAHV